MSSKWKPLVERVKRWWRGSYDDYTCRFFAREREIPSSFWISFVLRKRSDSVLGWMEVAAEKDMTTLFYGSGYYASDGENIYCLSLVDCIAPALSPTGNWQLAFPCTKVARLPKHGLYGVEEVIREEEARYVSGE